MKNAFTALALVLMLLATDAHSAVTPKQSKTEKPKSSTTPALLVPLAFDQIVTQNKEYSGHNGKVLSLAYSSDASRLVSGGDDKSLILWDMRSGEPLWIMKEFPDRVSTVSFCAGGEVMALSTKGKEIHLVATQTGAYVAGFSAKEDIQSLACQSKGNLLAAATDDKKVALWDISKIRSELAELTDPKKEGIKSDWQKIRKQRKKELDQAAADKAALKPLQESKDDLYSVAFSPNGDLLAASGKNRQVIIWDASKWEIFKKLEGLEKGLRMAIFSPDGRRLAAVEDKQKIVLWDIYGDGKPVLLGTEKDDITGISFSPDGSMIAASGKKQTALWSARAPRKIHNVSAEKLEALSVVFSPDGGQVAIAGDDKKIHFWNVPGIVALASAESSIDAELASLDRERDEKIKGLYTPRSEFESSGAYEARLNSSKSKEESLRREYKSRRATLESRLENEMKKLKTRLYPYTAKGDLGRYDADRGQFVGTMSGSAVAVNIPMPFAREIAERKEKVTFSGMIRYYDKQQAEFVNGVVVDPQTGTRFVFGKQVEGGAQFADTRLQASSVAPTSTSSSKRAAPPALEILSVNLLEPSGNNALDAGERGSIRVSLRNSGKGEAEGVSVAIQPEGKGSIPSSLSLQDRFFVGSLSPNETKSVDLDISASDEIPDRQMRLRVSAMESNAYDATPLLLDFSLKAMIPPELQLVKLEISDAEGKRVISKGKEVSISLTIRNSGGGVARGVTAGIDIADQNVKLFGESEAVIGTMKPGETRRAVFNVAVTQRYSGSQNLPVSFRISEERPRYGSTPNVRLLMDHEAPEIKLVKVKEKESSSLVSAESAERDDVSMVPVFAVTRRVFSANDLAVVIGVERYQSIPKSDFAYNDARSVKSYLLSLGFAERNIEFLSDERATLSSIRKSVETWLPNRVKKGSRIFFYYSGHGAPDPATGDAYIVPFDGDPSYLSDTGYPVKRLYEKLGAANAAEVIVVIDSCFSGSGGRSVMAKGARPLVVMTDSPVIPSNMAILSSTQGSQISTSYQEKEHGLFTYYFLKAIKEGKGDINELFQYIKPQVEDIAKGQNVNQSPVLNVGVNGSEVSFKLLK